VLLLDASVGSGAGLMKVLYFSSHVLKLIGFVVLMIVMSSCQTTSEKQRGASAAPASIPASASFMSDKTKKKLQEYLGDDMKDYKIFYASRNGVNYGYSFAFQSVHEADLSARNFCKRSAPDCELFAIGNTVVYRMNSTDLANAISRYEDEVLKLSTTPDKDGKILSGYLIKSLLTDQMVEGKTFSGQKFNAMMFQNGKVIAELENIKADVNKSDQGRWWTKDDKYCRRMNSYYNQKTECFSIAKVSEGYEMINDANRVAVNFRIIGSGNGSVDGSGAKAKTPEKQQSTKKRPQHASKLSYNLGRLIGYSGICGQFRGNAVNNKTRLAIERYFSGDEEYDRGKSFYISTKGADYVSGLNSCDKVKGQLIRFQTEFIK
jgi:hypothetical protein